MIFCKAALKQHVCKRCYTNRIWLDSCSGKPSTLWLPEAEEHVGAHTYARPEGHDAGNTLRELPRSVYPEYDPHGGQGEKTQVRG